MVTYLVMQFSDAVIIRTIMSTDTIEADGTTELKKDDIWLGKYRAGDLEDGVYDEDGKRLPDDGT